MSTCPACTSDVPRDATECPGCHLSVGLFDAVRDAAGPVTDTDPAYLRTIGELLASVDLTSNAPPPSPAHGLLSRPVRPPLARVGGGGETARPREPSAVPPVSGLPPVPRTPSVSGLNKRIDEYFQLGRRLGLDFTDFETRAGAASLTRDEPSLEALAREMFVHLASAVVEEQEATLARRNELAQLVPTPSADVELRSVQGAIDRGDLLGAERRLEHLRDELSRLEEEWEVGRILSTECDLLLATIRELGGDPAPALGPLEQGRRAFGKGQRADAERLLSRAAVALWTILEPRFFDDLHRRRDRLVELRAAGTDIAPAVAELRDIATELRQRNFVGTITAYRRMKEVFDRAAAPTSPTARAVAVAARSPPSA